MEEGVEVAWNCVKLGGLREIERQKLLAEVELLKQLDHKNIIRFLRSWLAETPAPDGEGPKEYRFNFITEKCSDNLRKCAACLVAARRVHFAKCLGLKPLLRLQLLPQAQEGRSSRFKELV